MSRNTWSGWTNWVPFHTLDWTHVPTSYGAYAIAASDGIDRRGGVDSNGLLVVGKASAVSVRLRAFLNSALDANDDSHPVGQRFHAQKAEEKWPLDTLLVAWCQTIDEDGAHQAELEVLRQYVARFNEPPPLQLAVPKELAVIS